MTLLTIKELYGTGYFSGLDYNFVRTIGQLGGEKNPLVLLAAALVSRFTRQGHVCLDLGAVAGTRIVTDAMNATESAKWPALEAWLAAISDSKLVSRESVSAPLVLDRGNRLYLARYWQYQQRLVAQIVERSSMAATDIDPELLADGLERLFPGGEAGSEGQRKAAETSVRQNLTVISGGPGTGKTYTVVKMLQLIIEQAVSAGKAPPRILLSAPTGKAAARLKVSVAAAKASGLTAGDAHLEKILALIPDDAATIHRLLRYSERHERGAEEGTAAYLPVDVLVVDEASMVDLSLMTRLMESLPTKARVVLLGDRDQLASVEAGAILGDICRGATFEADNGTPSPIARSVVSLTRSFRFDSGGSIGALAAAIREGDFRQTMTILQDEAYPDVVFRSLQSPGALPELLREISKKAYLPYFTETDPTRKMAIFNGLRILCAHRKGVVGVETVNAVVEAFLLSETGRETGISWYPGRPVMVSQNDYQVGLFNGDIGMVLPGKDQDGLEVYFQEQEDIRRISPSRMPAHTTVYAMTVHKSQGSEFDDVVLVLPPHRSPVVTRELLYTAVTRARKRVEIIGSEKIIREAVETPVQRASGMMEQLSGAAA
jgi:exodeoxyribonuclease V alpha subunit